MNFRPSKMYYVIILILFLLSILTGYMMGIRDLAGTQEILTSTKDFSSQVKSWGNFLVFVFIFFNNSVKALLTILLGVIFFPLYFISLNGFLIGLVMALINHDSGVKVFLAGTLPHGVFELTAIIMASSYGFWLGVKFFKKIFRRDDDLYFKKALVESFRIYFSIILPLLFVAALIEAYITPKAIEFFSK